MRVVVIICTLALVAYCLAAPTSEDEKKKAAKKLVIKLNGKNNGEWKAKYHKGFAHMTEEQRRMMAGGNGGDQKDRVAPEPEESEEDEAALIKSAKHNEKRRRKREATCTYKEGFDVRTKWPGCAEFVNDIQNQATCGSCWAVSTASAYTDRYCIERAKKGMKTDFKDPKNRFSAADIMSCANGGGCNGGSVWNAFMYINKTGIVSGSDYVNKTGCKPYPFDPNNWQLYKAPACAQQCLNGGYKTPYKSDKKFAKGVTALGGGTVNNAKIEDEIRNNGPVVATMDVYQGLYYYSKGIYKHVSDKYSGCHAIKIVGWGTQTCSDGTKQDYWTIANSWGKGWGEKGFFKLTKGTNECGIEQKDKTWATPVV